ncbi:MAG: MFS transporter [Cellulomonas sp. 73-92]|uniref:MFS transporter n=1 Tax=Cellulomonas sp. 73-92 TaxID=1895740 RepID=UPI000927A9DE|nr:MFS transporter [Cellulomonas sp. 73-92]OJV76585.1 MAG: MFS transporter [Cellulomonas sp. 73-92]
MVAVTGQARSGRMAIGAGGLVGFLVCVELTSGIIQGYYAPLLTDIARHLAINDADVNWFEAAGLLLSALVVPTVAKAGDLYGYRRMLLATAGITAVASWGLAFAPNFATFVVAWALQAFYVAWLPLEVALIHARGRGLPDAESATRRATGFIVAALQAGAIVGALLSGQLSTALGVPGVGLPPGRLQLLLCVPAVAVTAVVVIIWRRVPEPARPVVPGTLDSGGIVLISLALVLMSGGMTFMRLDGAGVWWPWVIVAAGVLMLVPFGRWELRQSDPLIDLRVLARPTMWPLQLTALLFGVSVLGAQGPLSTFARTDPTVYGYGLGASEFVVSLLVGGYVIFSLLGALAFPLVARTTTPRLSLIIATSFVAVGYLLFLPFHHSTGQLLTNMAIAGLGSGALVAALPSAAAAAAPTGRTAVATGLTNTTKTIGGTFASATFALALSAGVHTTLGGAEGTAGSLSGYMTVWAVCGLTAVVAALCLVVIPRLAFADRSSDAAASPTDEPGAAGDHLAGAVDVAGDDEPGGERTGVRA